VEISNRQVANLAVLLGDLLAISRLDTGRLTLHPRPTELNQLAQHTVDAFLPGLERGIQLEARLAKDPVWVHVDPVRLDQVLTNLLDNAAKHSRDNGHIWLEIERRGAEVQLRVRDDGAGIPDDLLPRIFEPFVRGDTSGAGQGGLGLGLALVKQLVERSAGRVEARSGGLDQGSELVITLPTVAAPTVDQPAEPEGEPGRKQRRVLIVEDNTDVAQTLKEMIERLGHLAEVASDGPAAIQAAVSSPPDLVLVDLVLPGMDGVEVAGELRRRLPPARTTLVALSGQPQSASAEAGFAEHILKPISLNRLRRLLESL
jgi:CheY-like chemotaxis protein/anti-sigma regulatory factor (Ser/Thr protein kinase)